MLNIYFKEQENTAELLFQGQISPEPGPELTALFQVLPQRYRQVTLNFLGLESISAKGLKALDTLNGELKQRGGTLILKNLSRRIMETLEIKGLIAGFNIQ